MALQQEILRFTAVAVLGLLRLCGTEFPLVPSATIIVTVGIIQTVSLFNCFATLPPTKKVVDDDSTHGAEAAFSAAAAALSNVVSVVTTCGVPVLLGIAFGKFVCVLDICRSLSQVAILACLAGGLVKYITALSSSSAPPAKPEEPLSDMQNPYHKDFWPQFGLGEELDAEPELPSAGIAVEHAWLRNLADEMQDDDGYKLLADVAEKYITTPWALVEEEEEEDQEQKELIIPSITLQAPQAGTDEPAAAKTFSVVPLQYAALAVLLAVLGKTLCSIGLCTSFPEVAGMASLLGGLLSCFLTLMQTERAGTGTGDLDQKEFWGFADSAAGLQDEQSSLLDLIEAALENKEEEHMDTLLAEMADKYIQTPMVLEDGDEPEDIEFYIVAPPDQVAVVQVTDSKGTPLQLAAIILTASAFSKVFSCIGLCTSFLSVAGIAGFLGCLLSALNTFFAIGFAGAKPYMPAQRHEGSAESEDAQELLLMTSTSTQDPFHQDFWPMLHTSAAVDVETPVADIPEDMEDEYGYDRILADMADTYIRVPMVLEEHEEDDEEEEYFPTTEVMMLPDQSDSVTCTAKLSTAPAQNATQNAAGWSLKQLALLFLLAVAFNRIRLSVGFCTSFFPVAIAACSVGGLFSFLNASTKRSAANLQQDDEQVLVSENPEETSWEEDNDLHLFLTDVAEKYIRTPMVLEEEDQEEEEEELFMAPVLMQASCDSFPTVSVADALVRHAADPAAISGTCVCGPSIQRVSTTLVIVALGKALCSTGFCSSPVQVVGTAFLLGGLLRLAMALALGGTRTESEQQTPSADLSGVKSCVSVLSEDASMMHRVEKEQDDTEDQQVWLLADLEVKYIQVPMVLEEVECLDTSDLVL